MGHHSHQAKYSFSNSSTVSLPAERLSHLVVPSTLTANYNKSAVSKGEEEEESFHFQQNEQSNQIYSNNATATATATAAAVTGHLTIPKSTSKQMSLSSSFNLSVIDLYGSPNSQEQDQEQGEEGEGQEDFAELSDDYEEEEPQQQQDRKPSIAQPQQSEPQINKSEYDRYGFRKQTRSVTQRQYDTWFQSKYQPHAIRRKRKWIQLFSKAGLATPDTEGLKQVRFPVKSEKLKRFVRKGIPAEWRGEAWWWFAKGNHVLQEGLYDELVVRSGNFKGKDLEVIERDLNRTFPDNLHFKSQEQGVEPEMIQSLRRVLVAFALYQPSIGYCQSLNFIVGLLLLFMSEERAFWMLVIITGRLLPGLHEMNLEGVNVSQGVLMLGLKEYVPSMFTKIMNISFDQESLKDDGENGDGYEYLRRIPPVMLTTSSWFMSVFIGSLPVETTLRVWDCLFYEDSVFMLKISLSLFKLIETQITAAASFAASDGSDIDEMEIFSLIQNYPKTLIDPSTLFDVIFTSRNQFNGLSQDDLVRCRQFVAEKRQTASKKNKNKSKAGGTDDLKVSRRLLANEHLWSDELYGFRSRSGAGSSIVRWNKDLSERVKRRMKR